MTKSRDENDWEGSWQALIKSRINQLFRKKETLLPRHLIVFADSSLDRQTSGPSSCDNGTCLRMNEIVQYINVLLTRHVVRSNDCVSNLESVQFDQSVLKSL